MLKRRLLRALGHQHALRFGFRDRILRRFDDPDRTSSAEFVVPFYGAKYRGNFDTFIDWSVYYYGAYERDDLELIGDFLAALGDPVFVDVGANVGHHTLFAAMRCRRVIAVEPFEPLVRRIRQKVDDNSLANVTIVACGLGERDETAPYTPSSTNNTGTGAFAVSSSGAAVMLPVRRGDEVLAETDGSSVGFLKIDTEGFEAPRPARPQPDAGRGEAAGLVRVVRANGGRSRRRARSLPRRVHVLPSSAGSIVAGDFPPARRPPRIADGPMAGGGHSCGARRLRRACGDKSVSGASPGASRTRLMSRRARFHPHARVAECRHAIESASRPARLSSRAARLASQQHAPASLARRG